MGVDVEEQWDRRAAAPGGAMSLFNIQHMTPWAGVHVETWQSPASLFKAVFQYLWVINEIKGLGYREWQMQFVQH